MNDKKTNLIWVDLEMTGLDPQRDEIIEIATIVTDAQLDILAEGPVIAIHQPDSVIATLDAWNRHHHGRSGLIERVRNTRTTIVAAESDTLAFVKTHVESGKSPMCGNTICQDRRFLARQMPTLEKFFHYRNLDVSTLKELVRRWYPDERYEKRSTHQALHDIRDSIAELRHYRERIFVPA